MLVVKYYKWNRERNVYELHTNRCTEIYSQNDYTIIGELDNSNELISVHLDQLISIKPMELLQVKELTHGEE